LGITVSAGSQPANSLAPANANRVPFTTFTISNNSGAAVTINGVDVQRTGLAADAAFAGVVLLDPNGVQIGTARTFNSNHQAEIGTPFTLNAGQSETFTVAGNMGSVATESNYSGQVASLSVVGIDTTVPVAGTLPITGASQTINSSLVIGTATVQRSSFDPLSPRSEPIGTTGLIFSGVRITAGSAENEKLYSITWNQTGSVGSGDLANLVTVVNGTSYPTTVDSTGKYYTSTFPGGITINEGQSADVYIQGDLVGGDASGRSVEFDVYRQTDIYLVGQTYGYGVTPTPNSVSSTAPASGNNSEFYSPTGLTSAPGQPFFEGAQVSVTAGTLSTVSNAGAVGSQNIAINVPNQPLGGFETDFTGEPVTVQSIQLSVATSGTISQLKSVSIVDQNGNVVAGPVDQSGTTITFNSSVTFPVGAETYTIKGETDPNALNGATIQLSTNPQTQWGSPQGQTSGSTVVLPSTVITMSTMTLQGGSLVVSAASTPASTTVAPGANNFVIANINLDASQSGEDIRLSSIPIVVDSTSTTAASTDSAPAALKAALTNCQLWNGSTALNSQSIGSSQWNLVTGLNSSGNPLSTGGLEANFVFQNAITIPKGTVTTLSLECNVSSSLYSGAKFAAGVDASQDTTTNLVPTGALSGNSIAASVTGNSVSGTMTLGTASLAVTVPTPISYGQVAGGTTGVTVGTFTLQPSSDSVNLQEIGLALNSNFASSSDIARAYIYNGATQIGSVIFTGSPVSFNSGMYYLATSSISTLSIPQNVQTVLTIKADVNNVGTGQAAMSGHEIRIGLADAQGVGASSGSSVNSGIGTAPTTGIAIFHSYPTVALSSSLPTNGVSDGRLIAFSVTANASNPVGIDQFVFKFASSTGTTISSPALYAYTDSGFSQPAGGTAGGIVQNGASNATSYSVANQTATTTLSTSPLEIPAGTTWYFLLKGTVTLGTNTNNNISTTLQGDTTDLAPNMETAFAATSSNDLVWSPNSNTTSLVSNTDWTNGFGVQGLPSIGITENRTN
jgi:hypothetical protein